MAGAARVLARGWWRSMRGWWAVMGAVLVVVQVLVVSVAAVFGGMEDETEARVAAFYTEDLRITQSAAGAVPKTYWRAGEVDEAIVTLGSAGTATPRMEAQFVLSRRSLLQAYLQEQEQFDVQTPGAGSKGPDAYGLGVLVGLPEAGSGAWDGVRPHVVAGRLPEAGNSTELLMGVRAFEAYLARAEAQRMRDEGPGPLLEALRFEVTSARVDPEGETKDIIRRPARVVGLFTTGVDTLDAFTVLTDIGSVKALVALPPDEPAANVLMFTGDRSEAAELAGEQGWHSEDPSSFTRRYLGQMVRVLGALSIALSGMFAAVPLLMAGNGVAQMLRMHEREYAVCRAIGVPGGAVAEASARLVGAVVGVSIVVSAACVALLDASLDGPLARSDALPIPLRYSVEPWFALAVAGGVVLGMAVAVALALRRHLRADLAGALRTA